MLYMNLNPSQSNPPFSFNQNDHSFLGMGMAYNQNNIPLNYNNMNNQNINNLAIYNDEQRQQNLFNLSNSQNTLDSSKNNMISSDSLLFSKPVKLTNVQKNEDNEKKNTNLLYAQCWNNSKPRDFFKETNNTNDYSLKDFNYSQNYMERNSYNSTAPLFSSNSDSNTFFKKFNSGASIDEASFRENNQSFRENFDTSKIKVNVKKNRNKSDEDLEMYSVLNIRPKRYIDSFTNENNFQKRGRSASPNNFLNIPGNYLFFFVYECFIAIHAFSLFYFFLIIIFTIL